MLSRAAGLLLALLACCLLLLPASSPQRQEMTLDEWLYLNDSCLEFWAIQNSTYQVLIASLGVRDSLGTLLNVQEVLRGTLPVGAYRTSSEIHPYRVVRSGSICSQSVPCSQGDTLLVLAEAIGPGTLRIPGVGCYPYSAARRDSAATVISKMVGHGDEEK